MDWEAVLAAIELLPCRRDLTVEQNSYHRAGVEDAAEVVRLLCG